MKRSFFVFCGLFIGLMICPAYSIAQVSSAENQACNPNFAKILVEQQVSGSQNGTETGKRIKIMLRAADFLWKIEESLARKYYSDAFKVAADRLKERKDASNKETNSKVSSPANSEPDYRMQVISAIAQKDGEWAKKLMEQVLSERQKATEEKNIDDTPETGELMEIAQDAVKTNPDLSRYIFRRLMNYPLDGYWYDALYSAAGDNRQFADELYTELLQKYANETPRRLLYLSAYPFATERVFGIDKLQFGAPPPATVSPNQNLQKQFLETFFRRVSVFANNPEEINRPAEQFRQPEVLYLVSALNDIEPFVVQNFPDLLQRFFEARAQANGLMSEGNKQRLENKQKDLENIQMGFEGKLKLLEKAEEEGKLTDAMIIQLVIWGEKTEPEFKQLEPWLDKIRDEKARRDAAGYFYFKRSERARKNKSFDEAKKYAEKVEEIDQRAILYFEIAKEQLKEVNNAAQVTDSINEVSNMVQKSTDSVAKAQILLGLAGFYEKVNHGIALDRLGEAIRVINKLENPNIFASSINRRITANPMVFLIGFSAPGYNMESTFQEISKKDFSLSLVHAESLNDRYFQTLAVLAVAKNCVEATPKKKTVKK